MTVFTGAGPPAPPPPPGQRQQRTTRVRRADGNVFTVDVGGNVKPGTYKHTNARRITCQNCQAVITGFSSFQGEHITCEANLLYPSCTTTLHWHEMELSLRTLQWPGLAVSYPSLTILSPFGTWLRNPWLSNREFHQHKLSEWKNV